MNTFCITEIACPEVDILRIQDFYNSHETTFSKEKNSLGIIVFRGMIESKKFEKYFPSKKYNEDLILSHGGKIDETLRKRVFSYNDENALKEINDLLYNSHFSLKINPLFFEMFEALFFSSLQQAVGEVMDEELKKSWQKLFLTIWKSFNKFATETPAQ